MFIIYVLKHIYLYKCNCMQLEIIIVCSLNCPSFFVYHVVYASQSWHFTWYRNHIKRKSIWLHSLLSHELRFSVTITGKYHLSYYTFLLAVFDLFLDNVCHACPASWFTWKCLFLVFTPKFKSNLLGFWCNWGNSYIPGMKKLYSDLCKVILVELSLWYDCQEIVLKKYIHRNILRKTLQI